MGEAGELSSVGERPRVLRLGSDPVVRRARYVVAGVLVALLFEVGVARGELGLGADPLAVLEEDEGQRRAQQGDEREQQTGKLVAHFREHLVCEQRLFARVSGDERWSVERGVSFPFGGGGGLRQRELRANVLTVAPPNMFRTVAYQEEKWLALWASESTESRPGRPELTESLSGDRAGCYCRVRIGRIVINRVEYVIFPPFSRQLLVQSEKWEGRGSTHRCRPVCDGDGVSTMGTLHVMTTNAQECTQAR